MDARGRRCVRCGDARRGGGGCRRIRWGDIDDHGQVHETIRGAQTIHLKQTTKSAGGRRNATARSGRDAEEGAVRERHTAANA